MCKVSLGIFGVAAALAGYSVFACGSDDPAAIADAPDGAGGAPGADTSAPIVEDGGGDASPAHCADYNPPKNPYFGDLHSHTSYSADAYSFDTRNTPLDAYAFARGKPLQIAGAGPDGGGPTTTIEKPLDFLAVTDHSELLAVAYGCGDDLEGQPVDPNKTIYDTVACKAFRSDKQALEIAAIFAVAYPTQESLWKGLSEGCDGGECEALTIPHNSNLSQGLAFEVPSDPADRERMIRYQRLVEILERVPLRRRQRSRLHLRAGAGITPIRRGTSRRTCATA
jgi:hypothetical protein